MAKRTGKKSTSSTPRKKTARKTSSKQGSPLPGPHLAEQMMQGLFGGGPSSEFNAQEYAFEAMDAMVDEDWDRAFALATKAVDVDPNCVDALRVLSQLGSENEEELIENLRRTVDRGERALGKKFFKENVGWFWGLIETRPYMRARAQLASLLNGSGKTDEAIEHYEEMLRLNPNDNQGLRYSLLGCYLEQHKVKGAERLFAEYPDEGSAMFAWARVLTSILAEDEAAAEAALPEARRANKYVEPFITGRKKLPSQGPDYYSPGQESEAVVCMHEIGAAWGASPAAVDWLKRQKAKRK